MKYGGKYMSVRLETERLVIRDYELNDLENLHKLLSDKVNMYFLDDIITNTINETKENLQAAIKNEDGHYFCICDKQTGEFIGSIGYTITDINPLGKVVHMGFFILPEFHGKGYTAEAGKTAINFAFKEDGCIRMTTGCYKDNLPSQKVIGKLDFRKESVRIKAQYHDGVMKDRLEYAINKDEIKATNKNLIEEVIDQTKKSAICNNILRDLPDWFGVEESIQKYVSDVKELPFYVVFSENQPVGFIALKAHKKTATEIFVMGIKSGYHRQAIGQQLIQHATQYCKQNCLEFLTVKILDETRKDNSYEKTRKFYLANGFKPIEVFPTLWNESNPCLLMIKDVSM